ncbi:MAG TPA: methyltransferase domain-containing protein [Solirubrobacterales bacterium]|nr:methyltransferase domain-containing protein [Solirubrobacterales bacterium]
MSAQPPRPRAAPAPWPELSPDELKSCCATAYEHPAVRWLLGGELHPGGEATTRHALDLIGVGSADELLDVASGTGASALLAAGERGCRVIGVDFGTQAVLGAASAAEASGLGDRVRFVRGDAESLPLEDDSVDAVLCECSLCTFPDKPRAVEEMRRVLRPGGRVAISDVVIDPERLPAELLGPLPSIACVGSALPPSGYEDLLAGAGLEVFGVDSRPSDAAAFARRIEERLRGARILGLDGLAGALVSTRDAIELVRAARRAIDDGSLGYAIIAARLPDRAPRPALDGGAGPGRRR